MAGAPGAAPCAEAHGDAKGTGVGGLLLGVCAIGERTVALRLESGSKTMLGKDRCGVWPSLATGGSSAAGVGEGSVAAS